MSVKQPRTMKTIIYNDIFTSLRRKKVQSPAKQFKELFSLVCYFFALNYLKTAFTWTNQNWVIFFMYLIINFFFSVRERAVFYKSYNLIGSESGQYSPHPARSQRAESDPFKKKVSKFSWKPFKSSSSIITQINMFWWNLSLSFALPLFSLPSTRS